MIAAFVMDNQVELVDVGDAPKERVFNGRLYRRVEVWHALDMGKPNEYLLGYAYVAENYSTASYPQIVTALLSVPREQRLPSGETRG